MPPLTPPAPVAPIPRPLQPVPPIPGSLATTEAIIKQIGEAIKSAYVATAEWGKENLTEVTSDECLLGAIHQYRMWQVSFNATYALFETQAPVYLDVAEGVASQPIEGEILPIIERSFTTDSGQEKKYIRNPMDLAYWANKADWTQLELEVEHLGEGTVYDYDQQHGSIIGAIKACKDAIELVDKDQLAYNNSGLVVSIGLLMLQTPDALDRNDIIEILKDIELKLSANRQLLSALSMVPSHQDENIERLMEEFLGMGLNDYVDNILTGRIFGLGEASSHAAALVNMLVMAEGLLAPCLGMVNGGKNNMGALSGSMSDGLAKVGKLIALITSYIEMATRTITEAAMDLSLAAIGGSSAIIKSMMGLKMQIQEWQKKGEDAIRGISIGKVMAPPGEGECPLTAIINVESAKAMAEAGIKNALMMPLMAIANEVLKPILEMISDISGEIMSLQSMLGASLAAAFNTISIQRWVDYALVYQLNKMRETVQQQINYYQELRQQFTLLKNRIKPPDKRYEMLDRIFKSYVRRIADTAKEHDDMVARHQYAYNKTVEAARLLGAASALLIKRSGDDKDKNDVIATMKQFDAIVERGEDLWESANKDIREVGKNLDGLWKELTDGRAADLVGRELRDFGDTFREYARTFKVIFGLDLDKYIDQLEVLLWGMVGPKPEPGPYPPNEEIR